jgi:hypothetical protein
MRTFLIPGLVSLATFQLLWAAAPATGMPIRFANLGFTTIPVYPHLILSLPLIGSLGAYTSLRLGGSRLARIGAGLFSAVPLAIGYPDKAALWSDAP